METNDVKNYDDIYKTIIIPENTILYSGGQDTCNVCPHSYIYKGQSGVVSSGKIIYLTNNLSSAEGYAKINLKNSYVKKFKVKKNIELYDITKDKTHMEWDELENNICNNKELNIHNGYYIDWTIDENINKPKIYEIALCNAPEYLEYLESKKCKNHICEDEFTCKISNENTKAIINKLNKGNNCIFGGYLKKSIKHKSINNNIIKKSMKYKKTNSKKKSKHVVKKIKQISNDSIKLYHKKQKTYKIVKMLSNIKKFNNFYKNLSKEKKDVIKNYKGIGYVNINQYLYKNNKIDNLTINKYLYDSKIKNFFTTNTRELFDYKNISIEKIPKFVEFYINKNIIDKINILDSIFTEKNISKLDGSEILFRGSRGHSITNEKNKVGDEIIIKNFCSSSSENEISMYFTNLWSSNLKNICCLYVISGLKNIPYIFIPWNIEKQLIKQHISIVEQDEFEYLLPRNLKFKISKISKGFDNDSKILNLNKITFEKFDKMLNGKSLNNMNNNDIQSIIDKLYKKINVYHLEFIEQIPIKPLEPYIYKQNINLHFQSNDSNKIKSINEAKNNNL